MAIGNALAQVRAERKLSARELSERCAELGYPIPRNTIANLESGRKRDVPIQEIAVLAAALRVPPMRLMASLGETGRVPVLPRLHADPVDAVRWLSGEGRLRFEAPGDSGVDGGWPSKDEDEAYRSGLGPLELLRTHYDLELQIRALGPNPLERDPMRASHLIEVLIDIRDRLWHEFGVPYPRLRVAVWGYDAMLPEERKEMFRAIRRAARKESDDGEHQEAP